MGLSSGDHSLWDVWPPSLEWLSLSGFPQHLLLMPIIALLTLAWELSMCHPIYLSGHLLICMVFQIGNCLPVGPSLDGMCNLSTEYLWCWCCCCWCCCCWCCWIEGLSCWTLRKDSLLQVQARGVAGGAGLSTPHSLFHLRTLGLQADLKGWGEGWARARLWPLGNHAHSSVLGDVGSVVRLGLRNLPATDHRTPTPRVRGSISSSSSSL